jgi:hypothetical protein
MKRLNQNGTYTQYVQNNTQVNLSVPGKNSVQSIGEGLSSLNRSLGESFTPVSFKNGVSMSISWILFISIWFSNNPDFYAPIAILWLLSLFIKRRCISIRF